MDNTWVIVNSEQINFWMQTDVGLNLSSSRKKKALFFKNMGRVSVKKKLFSPNYNV